MKVSGITDFPNFTKIFHFCRPKEIDLTVYEIDAGLPTEPNIFMRAAKIEDDKIVGETSELIVAKEWIRENMQAIIGTEDVHTPSAA